MIKFEFCDAANSRPVRAELKALSGAMASADATEGEKAADELFSLETDESAEEDRTGAKTRRGRSKKFRRAS